MTTPDTNGEIKVVADDLYKRVFEWFSRCEKATQENIAHEFYLIAARIATEERERCALAAARLSDSSGDNFDYFDMGKVCAAQEILEAIRSPNPPVSEPSL